MDQGFSVPTPTQSGAIGGEVSGVANDGVPSEMVAPETPVEGAITEGMPTVAQDTQPKLVPETDLRKLQSTYDRRISQMEQQLKAATDVATQLQRQQQEYDKQMFEFSIAQLPEPQQAVKRAEFNHEQEKQNLQLQYQQKEQQQMAFWQMMEPVVRREAAANLAQNYGLPPESVAYLEQITEPVAMKWAADALKKSLGQTQRVVQKQQQAHTFEGVGGGSAKPDVKKDYRGTGRIADYLKALRA